MEGWKDGKLLDRPVKKRYNILFIVEDFSPLPLFVSTNPFMMRMSVSSIGILLEEIKMTNEELYELMKDGFAQVNQRIDQGLENVNQRLDQVDQRLDRVDQRLDSMDERLRTVEGGISELKGKQSAISGMRSWILTVCAIGALIISIVVAIVK